MTKGLILDSSSNYAVIAEVEEKNINRHKIIFSQINLSNVFFSFLEKSKKDFKYIAVGIGPGAYTGVRISLTIAKALAYALNIPVITFSSLSCFIPHDYGKFISLLDAKIGGVYTLIGDHQLDNLNLQSPNLYSIDQIKELIVTIPKVISPEIDVLRTKINLSSNVEWILGKPNLKLLAKTCFTQYLKQNFTTIKDLKPIYLRDA